MKTAIITDKFGIKEKIWELKQTWVWNQARHCVTLDKWLCLLKFSVSLFVKQEIIQPIYCEDIIGYIKYLFYQTTWHII